MENNIDDRSLVSIICASYNSEAFITDTINSVIGQDYQYWELLIIDDCSIDNTYEIIIKASQEDDRIKIFKNSTNIGSGLTRNVGIKNAKGKFLTFIDSDDLWERNFLSTNIEFQKINACQFSFASYRRVDENLSEILSPFIVPSRVCYQDMLRTGSISCLTAFIDIECLGKKYMPEIRKRQDYIFFLSYLKEIDFAYGIDAILATYRIRKNSVSRNKISAMKAIWVVYRKYEKFSIFRSIIFISIYAFYGVKKYYFSKPFNK